MRSVLERVRSLIRCREANAAVEFALVAPILIMLLAGVVDLGRAAYDRMSLETAARAGVQYARQDPSNTAGITAAAVNAGGLAAGRVTVASSRFCECPDGSATSCTGSCATGAPLVFLSVTVTETFQALFPYEGLLVPTRLTGTATLRMQ